MLLLEDRALEDFFRFVDAVLHVQEQRNELLGLTPAAIEPLVNAPPVTNALMSLSFPSGFQLADKSRMTRLELWAANSKILCFGASCKIIWNASHNPSQIEAMYLESIRRFSRQYSKIFRFTVRNYFSIVSILSS